MDIKTGLVVLTLLSGYIALETFPRPEDDPSIFFEHNDDIFRISGGTEAAEGSHPHMVALTVGVPVSVLFCGGSLVAHRTVLTAAHCLHNMDITAGSLRAVVGTNHWNFGGTTYALSRGLIHPGYVVNAYVNDIALLYTASDVIYNTLVRPVALSFAIVPQGILVRVAGWGSSSVASSTRMSNNLQELVTTTLDGNDCAARWSNAPYRNTPPLDPRNQVCTFHSIDHGICYGDSGSALIRVDNGQQIGVVSWMFPCAQGFPDVYVRISSHQSWLQANIVD